MHLSPTLARRPRVSAFVFVVLLAALPARATVVFDPTLERLAGAATRIVRGVVETTRATEERGERGERGTIATYTRVRPLVELKRDGRSGALTVRQVGGTVNGRHLEVPGDAKLAPGEEVVLFLQPLGDAYVLVAVGAAKFRVERRSGAATVTRDLSNVAVAQPGPGGALRPAAPTPETPVTLEAFERRVRAAVGR